MDLFGVSGLALAIVSLAFGVFVLFKTKNRKLGRAWFAFTVAVAAWGVGTVWISAATTTREGLLAWRLTYVFGVLWIAPLLLHFNLVFVGRAGSIWLWLNYVVGAAFALQIQSPLFFRGTRIAFNSIHWIVVGPLYPLFIVWWVIVVSASLWLLVRTFHLSSSLK
jgi:hypothetical protein